MDKKNIVRINEWSEMISACRNSGLTMPQWYNANDMNSTGI